jgi:hypothetical protein
MTYVRKTVDTWQMWVNYGQGFEHELTESTYKEIRERRKEYRENCPEYPTKIKFRREKKENIETIDGKPVSPKQMELAMGQEDDFQ